jgi:hypothetical protein
VDGHRAQAARFKRLGAEYYVVYQIQSAPNPNDGEQYGIRSADGTWKATANLPLEAL